MKQKKTGTVSVTRFLFFCSTEVANSVELAEEENSL